MKRLGKSLKGTLGAVLVWCTASAGCQSYWRNDPMVYQMSGCSSCGGAPMTYTSPGPGMLPMDIQKGAYGNPHLMDNPINRTSGQQFPIRKTTYASLLPPQEDQAPKPMVMEDTKVPTMLPMMDGSMPGPGPIPTEKGMVSHPSYRVAAPDILFIDAIRLVPRPPYRVEPLEVLLIHVNETLPNQPITGLFTVSPEGMVNLGFDYGSVRVAGLTLDQIQGAIRQHLSTRLRNPQVAVALAQFRGLQQVRGEHLVRPDGTISLGTYGSVYVAGLTLEQSKFMIEKHLSQFLLDPQIAVDVFAYNSQVYYVIVDGGGFGQQVFRLPVTGNETVLDGISMVLGLAPVSSKKHIYLARPSPAHMGCNQVMPIDWEAILHGSTATNYQVFPGDRIYIKANKLIALDNYLSMVLAPIERIFGVTLLGSNTVQSVRNVGRNTGVGLLGFGF